MLWQDVVLDLKVGVSMGMVICTAFTPSDREYGVFKRICKWFFTGSTTRSIFGNSNSKLPLAPVITEVVIIS